MPKKASIKILEKDKGWKQFQHNALKLSKRGAYALVGVQGAEASANHQHANLSIATIATIHEFGATMVVAGRTIVIPQRSFIRGTIDAYHAAIQKRATLIGTGVVLLKFSVDTGLNLLGAYAVGLMKQRIADRIAPPNRPSTKARKGSDVPLVDTGQLRGAITHVNEVE